MPKGEVTIAEFHGKMYRHRNDVCTLELDGWELPILHSLAVYALHHPGMKKPGTPMYTVCDGIRGWCLRVMRTWGFTNDQLKTLDAQGWQPEEEPDGHAGGE